MRKWTLLGILAALLAALSVGATSASATTWDGSCDMDGKLVFSHPYHLLIENNDYQTFVSGTCKGTLDGKPYDGPSSIYVDGRMNKPMSCEAGLSDQIPGVQYFGSGSPDDVDATLLYNNTVVEFHVGPVLPFNWTGQFNGEGVGLVTLVNPSPDQFQQCAGAGLNEAPIHLQNQTLTPMYG